MRKSLAALAILLGLAAPLAAQWDPTKPSTQGAPVSADIRNNWNALAQTLAGVNLVADPTFLIWAAGDSAAPSYYTLAGAGAAVARAGTGLGDTNRKVGDFAAKVTSAAATATLTQQLLPTAAFTRANYLQGQTVSAGAWVRTSTAAAVRVCFDDGIGQSCSAFHAGGSVWSWLTVSRTISGTATKLTIYLEVATGTITGYWSGPTAVLGPAIPQYFQDGRARYSECRLYISGAQTTGTDKDRCSFVRPAIVKDVQLMIKTAPTGQALIVDVNTWDGAALTSMYSTRPQIGAGANLGGAQPDTTYARRCTSSIFGTTLSAGGIVSVDIDQVGSGAAGSDLWILVRYLTYDRPLEEVLSFGDVN